MSLVVDTSLFADLVFKFNEKRTRIAEEVLSAVSDIVNPRLFKVEIAGILARRLSAQQVEQIVSEIMEDVKLIDNPDELAFQIAAETGSRAADAYFIATAKLTNSILLTNDRIMALNAKKVGIEAYYLIEEFDAAMKRISEPE
ncbi:MULTISPECIES: type II toxin-antitoxin system VapC family toxin [unclassified Archaeoglobus]|jgi:hypothetical protein|uniref:type II toxin-antitoxin system VapC family toxin n=1 Tax=unclassified Archaeoglobus TaxID=2643606 RepID=UPI0025C52D6B|nr:MULTISPECIES: type II toxin-antitoxin system VapC family toxin [unclassified Archaeoglobus]